MERKKTIVMGIINSAAESPNHVTLSALPLFKSKYLEMLVVAVCDINPWPDNLKRKMPTNNNRILVMKEKKIEEKNSREITRKE